MFKRNVLALSALVLFAAVLSIEAAEPEQLDGETVFLDEIAPSSVEISTLRNPIMKKVIKILEKAFKGVAKHCLEGAAKHCKKYWYNPPKVISCASDWLAGACTGI